MKFFKNKLNNSSNNHVLVIYTDNTDSDNVYKNNLITDEIEAKRLIVLTDSESNVASDQILDMYKNFFIQSKEFSNIEDFLHRTLLVSATMLVNLSLVEPEKKIKPVNVASIFFDNDEFYTLNAGSNRLFKISGKNQKELNIVEGNNLGIGTSITDLKIKTTSAEKLKNGDILVIANKAFYEAFEDDSKMLILVKKVKKKDNFAKILVDQAIKKGAKGNVSVFVYVH